MSYKNCFVKIPTDNEQGYRRLSYLHWGDENNENILLCVHGLSRNSHDFDSLSRELESDYRIIAVDIAGRGDSQWLEKKSDYNYHTYVSDVLFLLNELNIKSVDWVGTSMGGIIAMLVGAQNPSLVKKLVLNDVGAFISGRAIDRIFEYMGVGYEFSSKEKIERMLKIRMAKFGLRDEDWPHIFKYSIEKSYRGKFRFAYDKDIITKPSILHRVVLNIKKPSRWLKMPDVNLWPFWSKIKCPTLLIRGELSDILSKKTLDEMLSKKENLETYEVKGVGHAPMLMDPKQIAVLKAWLLK